ncbi:protein LUTEIN DEFICIENT 5, chloroplastic-like [Brassica napus]|uniref:protein LUTEIN DEFICIENT 5, chloroplastic-like n=1 Tax=Brassica napus TaxID=3708 RepID=UPI002078BE73|nr:protein LUTEIN DEFICIENT 5, chloroplastic-like [Brassica napus]
MKEMQAIETSQPTVAPPAKHSRQLGAQLSGSMSFSSQMSIEDEEMSRTALSAIRAKEEEIEKNKMEIRERVQAQLGRVEEETKRLALIREELEGLAEPMRKEVALARKKIDSVNKELKNDLSKLGVPSNVLDLMFDWTGANEDYLKVPEAKGSIQAVRNEAFFIPLYELFLTYGGIFRLTFGAKSFLIVTDPSIAKHILKDSAKAYSKGILAEILDFVMGKGLIPADGEIWRRRRRAIVPALHMKCVAAMISLFGEASDRLCQKLDTAASTGEEVEMESLFSRLTLDIIGKAVFNYDFDSLTNDTGVIEAVYTVLREAEDRSVSPIPVWDMPIWKDISPRQRKVATSLKLINDTLNDLIATCKRMIEEEELQFHEEYMNERDPSILHFLLASGDDVSSKQLRDDLMTMLIAGHETSAAVLTWTFYLLTTNPKVVAKLQEEVDSVIGDRFPTLKDIKKLKYTTRVRKKEREYKEALEAFNEKNREKVHESIFVCIYKLSLLLNFNAFFMKQILFD